MNGTKTTDKKFIAESFCDCFTNVAINLKKKSFLLRDIVWSNPSEIRLPQVKEKFLFRAVKEDEILTELKNLKRKKATGLDNLPSGMLKARLHRRFLSRQLDAIFVALKLQLQNRTCKPGAIFSTICRRDITGLSNMFET